MTTPLKTRAENLRLLSNSETLKYLKEYSERERERTGTVPLLIQRVLEYLYRFSKVKPEVAEEFRDHLSSLGLRDETIVMIMNICPRTHEELRTLLVIEDKAFETEKLEKIIDLVKEYCKE